VDRKIGKGEEEREGRGGRAREGRRAGKERRSATSHFTI